MKIIYHPKGKAGEYADYAANLYTGCAHGCTYCYAPLVMHKTREDFRQVQERKNILLDLIKDADYLRAHPELGSSVFLCFSCDPYPEHSILTREVIKALHAFGLSVTILTKGGMRAVRDFDILTDKDQFGVTLTCLNAIESLKWEPLASLPERRLYSLEQAHSRGVRTWVSLEPVLNPVTALEIIRLTHSYVDMYKVGVLNYHPLTQTIDWRKFGKDAIALLESLGKKYYIKQDLWSYLDA